MGDLRGSVVKQRHHDVIIAPFDESMGDTFREIGAAGNGEKVCLRFLFHHLEDMFLGERCRMLQNGAGDFDLIDGETLDRSAQRHARRTNRGGQCSTDLSGKLLDDIA